MFKTLENVKKTPEHVQIFPAATEPQISAVAAAAAAAAAAADDTVAAASEPS